MMDRASLRTALPKGLYVPFLLVSFLWMGAVSVYAQHSCNEFALVRHQYQIAFGETVTVDAGGETHGVKPKWAVTPTKGVSATRGEGSSTGELVFTLPGTYEVTFSVPAHNGEPAHTDKATVEVSGEKMKFLPAQATLSAPLVKGKAADGIVLTVPVEIHSFKDNAFPYGPATLQTTGIPGITATLAETLKLKNGTQQVSFVLSGTPNHSGAAQLGFFNLMGEGFFYNFLIAEQ